MNNKNIFKEQAKKAWVEIKKSKKISLLTHKNPDADGISACAALDFLLQESGKYTESIYPDSPEFILERQPKKVLINSHSNIPDLIIICDTATKSRAYLPKDFENIKIINIDHHENSDIDATYNFISTQVSSTCELLYCLFKEWSPKLLQNKYVAECLLTGILYDSQAFYTQNTYPSTLKISSDLMKTGANLHALNNELINNKNPNIIKLWGHILNNIHLSKEHNFAWCAVTQEDLNENKLELSSLVGFSNFLSQLSDIDVTIVFHETKDKKTRVSIRSKNKDVNLFAKQYGGGGHKNAAGIILDKPILESIDLVIGKLKDR